MYTYANVTLIVTWFCYLNSLTYLLLIKTLFLPYSNPDSVNIPGF